MIKSCSKKLTSVFLLALVSQSMSIADFIVASNFAAGTTAVVTSLIMGGTAYLANIKDLCPGIIEDKPIGVGIGTTILALLIQGGVWYFMPSIFKPTAIVMAAITLVMICIVGFKFWNNKTSSKDKASSAKNKK